MFAECCQQRKADHADVQAWLHGTETWIAPPREAWSAGYFNQDGTPTHEHPVHQLLRALSGHPGAGTFSEQLCDDAIVNKNGVRPDETWSSCYDHPQWKRLQSVYVGDFKMGGPEKFVYVAWKRLHTHNELA